MPQQSDNLLTYILYGVIIVVTLIVLKLPKKK
jgi:hypothetical protein